MTLKTATSTPDHGVLQRQPSNYPRPEHNGPVSSQQTTFIRLTLTLEGEGPAQ